MPENVTPTSVQGRHLLRENRDFTLLWIGQAVSALGNSAVLVAYPLLVLSLTQSPSQVGLVMAAATITQLVVAMPGGVLVDRMDKRRLMLGCDIVRAIAQLGLVAALATGTANIAIILAVAVIENAFAAVFSPAEETAVRQVVRPAELPVALSRNQARGAAAMLLGPPLGGLLFAIAPTVPFVFNAVSFVGSLICIAMIRSPMPSVISPTPWAGRHLVDGLSFLWRQAFLRVTLLLIAGSTWSPTPSSCSPSWSPNAMARPLRPAC